MTLVFNGIEFRQFDHLYAVSAEGLCLKLVGLKLFAGSLRPDGYVSVGRRRLLHRMVATCWCVRPEGSNLVHHINQTKADNRAVNLEWVTPSEHMGEKHSDAVGRYVRTEESRQKLRDYRTGRPTSEETKAKQRSANLRLGIRPPRRLAGSVNSEATRLKLRLNSGRAVGCEIDGVTYRSFSEAGRAVGMKPLSLRRRCHSNNFPTYKLLDD